MKERFLCELKPNLMAQQYLVKEPCSFYFKEIEGGRYEVFGLSSSGKQKNGIFSISNDDALERELYGSFTEDGVEIEVSFKVFFFEEGVLFGFGEWLETEGSKTRQKYSVQVRDVNFYDASSSFIDKVLSDSRSLQDELRELQEKLELAEGKVEELDSKQYDIETSVDDFLEKKDSLDEAVSEAETLSVKNEALLESLEEKKKASEVLKKELDDLRDSLLDVHSVSKVIKEAALEAKDKADDALSCAITVSIARSFKERKKEAARQRMGYDVLFVISLCLGILATYNIYGLLVPNGDSVVANFETLLSRLPFLVFFVWLGVFSSKKSSSASRIEEFYAQKQALAESYEGYKSEISDLGKGAKELSQLMAINLLSISKDSACIFDGVEKEKHSPIQVALEESIDKLFSLGRGRTSQSSRRGEPSPDQSREEVS